MSWKFENYVKKKCLFLLSKTFLFFTQKYMFFISFLYLFFLFSYFLSFLFYLKIYFIFYINILFLRFLRNQLPLQNPRHLPTAEANCKCWKRDHNVFYKDLSQHWLISSFLENFKTMLNVFYKQHFFKKHQAEI